MSNKIEAKNLRDIAFEMRVLLVDDDPEIRESLRNFLRRFFGHVDVASNGIEALELYDSDEYDLIITDLTMPQMDGLGLAKEIRKRSHFQRIVVVSAHSESQRIIELVNVGVDGYILKPIDVEQVIHVLYRSVESIYDRKMLEYLNSLLEQTNFELKTSNSDLECAMKKIQRLERGIKRDPDTKERLDAFYCQYSNTELAHLNEQLSEIEDSFNKLLTTTSSYSKDALLKEMQKLLVAYVDAMKIFSFFDPITHELTLLCEYLNFTRRIEDYDGLFSLIALLFDTLEEWRKSLLEYHNAESLTFMNSVIFEKISDIIHL